MGLIREPKEVDFIIESKPWTDDELTEFRSLLKKFQETKKGKLLKTASLKADKKRV